MMVLLPLYLFLQVLPPPFGQIVSMLVLGTASGGIDHAMPADCNCGVPEHPRGPR